MLGRAGRWERRGDFELAFQSAAERPVVFRVVQSNADLYLTSRVGDPDAWDGRLLVRHVRPAS